jgi:UDP-N-acetylglucosamine 2-epimerase
MSQVFFDELGIPPPEVNLGVGSGPHGAQTGAMLEGIERVLLAERPNWLLVYGDTNSTLAGVLAAAKLSIPVAHVEAGLRSFNRSMPEEVNRVVADHLSKLLFCPSERAVTNLADEGIKSGVHLVGDVMSDTLLWVKQRLGAGSFASLENLKLVRGGYLLCTVHRSENTDASQRLIDILTSLERLGERVVFPIHPRTRKVIESRGLRPPANVELIDPLGYEQMVALAGSARMILTDSGGLQKEAYWLGVPCVTLRDETEWQETVDSGWNALAGADSDRIVSAVRRFVLPATRKPLYGEGGVAARCVALLSDE